MNHLCIPTVRLLIDEILILIIFFGQVKQSSFVQRCNVSCKKENTDVKIGLQSLMTEINIKMDADTFRNVGTVVDEDSKMVVEKFIKYV